MLVIGFHGHQRAVHEIAYTNPSTTGCSVEWGLKQAGLDREPQEKCPSHTGASEPGCA